MMTCRLTFMVTPGSRAASLCCDLGPLALPLVFATVLLGPNSVRAIESSLCLFAG
jgi:hypothetical protein